MMRRRRTPLLALLVALVGLLLAGVAGAGPAAGATTPQVGLPSSAKSCVASGKVWVLAIDDKGGIVASGCVAAGGSGKRVLNSVAPVVERATDAGFVCQVNDVPNRCIEGNQWSIDPRYWQYHHAVPGGSWVYSNLGYTNRTPRPGSIEGWCLSAGPCTGALAAALNPGSVPGYVPAPSTKPTTAPTTTSPTKPTSKPTSKPTTKATSKATSKPPTGVKTTAPTTTKAASSTTSAPTTASATTAAATPASRSSAVPSATPSTTTATSTTVAPSEDASASVSSPPSPDASPSDILATPPAGGTGTPWGAITTGGLVAAAAGAFLVVRHRRGVTSEQ